MQAPYTSSYSQPRPQGFSGGNMTSSMSGVGNNNYTGTSYSMTPRASTSGLGNPSSIAALTTGQSQPSTNYSSWTQPQAQSTATPYGVGTVGHGGAGSISATTAPQTSTSGSGFTRDSLPMQNGVDANGNPTYYQYGAGAYSGVPASQQPTNVSPISVAETRSGFNTQTMPDMNAILSKMYQPDLNVQGPSVSLPLGQQSMTGDWNTAYQNKANLGMSDFGIPQAASEQMKVQEAQGINDSYAQQKEAAKRMLAKAGLTNDSASTTMDQQLNQGRESDISKSNNNIDVQNALQANQQRLQNMSDLLGAATNESQLSEQGRQANNQSLLGQDQLSEQGRQYNLGAQMDMGRLSSATNQFAANYGAQGNSMNEAIAEYLQNSDFNRLNIGQGAVNSSAPLSAARSTDLWQGLKTLNNSGNYG